MKNSIIVCEYGWIIIGKITEPKDGEIKVTEGSIVRSWGNGRGIGALAKEEHKNEYMLDYIGDVNIMQSKALFVIPCDWS